MRLKLFSIIVVILAASAVAAQHARTRTRWPMPTYTVEIRGFIANDFSVMIEGKYTKPDGKVVEIEGHPARLPVNFYVNADCLTELKVTTMTDRPFRVTVFYEHNDTLKWISTAPCANADGVSLELKPYEASQ